MIIKRMHKTLLKTMLWLSLSTFSLLSIQAQTHEFGLKGGIAHYRGELAPVVNLMDPGFHYGIFYRANLSSEWSLKASFSFSQIKDDDIDSEDVFAQTRNHRFETNIWEVSFQTEYNFLNFRTDSRFEKDIWTPYLFAGFGFFKMEPLFNGQPAYKTTNAVVPLGIGFKTVLAPRWDLAVEIGARLAFSDRLDDLGLDASPNRNLNPKYFSGNPNNNDQYFLSSISISYVLPDPGKDCPVRLPR